MRTFRITLVASLAGWVAGILAGNIGGLALAMLEYGPGLTLRTLTARDAIVSELGWASAVAIGMLPCCAFLVAPVVFQQVGKSSRWHPFLALCVGGAGGIIGFLLWLAVLMMFSQPFNWSRPGDRATAVMFVAAAFVIGATTGCVAALAARSYARAMPTPPASTSRGLPPPLPYEY